MTTLYPGASSDVVNATIAQPIEAQMVGVDKMIYMKSVSGNDGSYSLKVSFELGTDPDINTVNVNNRVQVALAKLPADVRQQGVTVKKQSSALLGVIAVYSPKATLRSAVHLELRHDQSARRHPQHAGCWRRNAVRAGRTTRCGLWLRTDRMTGLGLTPGDIIAAVQAQNVQARGRAHRRAADLERSAIPVQHPDQGPARHARGIRRHHPAHQPGWFRAARR